VYKATDAPIVHTKSSIQGTKIPNLEAGSNSSSSSFLEKPQFYQRLLQLSSMGRYQCIMSFINHGFGEFGRVVRSQLYINKFVPELCWMLRDGVVSLFSKFGKNPDHELASFINDGCVLGKSNMAVKSFRIRSPRASSHRMH
jgi:hypothetical protein